MKLNNDYWHQMDKASECCSSDANVNSLASNVGISHGVGDLVQGMKSKVFAGASHVELGFTGKGKGYLAGGQTTPGMFGSEQRRDIRQMSKINDVSVSTHATVAVTGLAGQTGEGSFSDEAQEQNLHEIKRAVEFAADTAGGGAVVFHVGEFPRPLAQYPHFEFHPKEKEKQVHPLVDNRTGRIIQTVKETETIYEPEVDKKTGQFLKDEQGNIKFKSLKFNEFLPEQEDREKAAKEFFLKTLEAEKQQAKGTADEYELRYEKALEVKQKYKEKLERYSYLKQVTPSENWEMMKVQLKHEDPFLGPEVVDPVDFLNKKVGEIDKEISFAKERVISSREQAKKVEEYEDRIEDIKSYATRRSADAVARAAIHAYDVTKQKGLKNPVFVAPENLFPEWGYGNHPQELKEMVIDARAAMADRLVKERGISKPEAERVAKDHINATFDIAHANLWKKFWKGDSKKSIEENNKEFDKWLVDEADQLNKAGVIGHVHLSDNFGYGDEHLSTGQGNTPVKEFLARMRKGGFKGKSIAEIGAQPQGKEHEALTEAWRHVHDLFSPIYRTDMVTRTWGDVGGSYFAHTTSPNFLLGETTPNPQEWVLYSGVPLE